MKKLLFFIILLIAAGGLYYWKNMPTPSNVEPGTVGDKTFRPDPRSATFKFDDGAITLSQGKNSKIDPETGETQETNLLDENAYGDLNNDGKQDAVVLVSRSGSGSGVFIYVAAYVSGTISYKGTSAVFLGDRISPQSISISNGVATVKYLDRKPDEPFAADPTVPMSKQFIYQNGEFVER